MKLRYRVPFWGFVLPLLLCLSACGKKADVIVSRSYDGTTWKLSDLHSDPRRTSDRKSLTIRNETGLRISLRGQGACSCTSYTVPSSLEPNETKTVEFFFDSRNPTSAPVFLSKRPVQLLVSSSLPDRTTLKSLVKFSYVLHKYLAAPDRVSFGVCPPRHGEQNRSRRTTQFKNYSPHTCTISFGRPNSGVFVVNATKPVVVEPDHLAFVEIELTEAWSGESTGKASIPYSVEVAGYTWSSSIDVVVFPELHFRAIPGALIFGDPADGAGRTFRVVARTDDMLLDIKTLQYDRSAMKVCELQKGEFSVSLLPDGWGDGTRKNVSILCKMEDRLETVTLPVAIVGDVGDHSHSEKGGTIPKAVGELQPAGSEWKNPDE